MILFKYFVCYFHVCQIESLAHFLADLCLKVMECIPQYKGS